jgi:hypothetical protein
MMSCGGNQLEKDAQEAAELYCELSKLTAAMFSGDLAAIEKGAALQERTEQMQEKLKTKYASEAAQVALNEAMEKALADMNCGLGK